MGLGFIATLQTSSAAETAPPWEQVCDTLRSYFAASIAEPILQRGVHVYTDEEVAQVDLHPTAEPMHFHPGPDGRVEVSLKTSTTGPGFHAWCVEQVETLAGAQGWALDWHADDPERGDETGYAQHRDFTTLQREMVGFLTQIGQILLGDLEADPPYHLNWAIDGPRPVSLAFATAPFGTWSRAWWSDLIEAEEPEQFEMAASFFAWWDEGFTPRAAGGYGQTLLWSRIAWHPPGDEVEADVMHHALAAYEAAGDAVPTPTRELTELRSLLEGDPEAPPIPAESGLGFHRGPMSFDVGGGWSLQLPGYFYHGTSEDGTVLAFWHASRYVEVSSLRWEGQGTAPDLSGDTPDDAEVLSHERDDLLGRASIQYMPDERLYRLQGTVQSSWEGGGSVCILTIDWADETDRDWAGDVYQSLRCQVPTREA